MQIYCVVLNTTYDPLAVVSSLRALELVFKGKARIKQAHPTRKHRSVNREFPAPTEIVLNEYRSTGAQYYKIAQLNQRNLFVRDNYTCGYCGRHEFDLRKAEVLNEEGQVVAGKEYLTRDHIIPVSRGGQDTWMNLITACSTCNHSKDSKLLEETGMELLIEPRSPTVYELIRKRTRGRKQRAA